MLHITFAFHHKHFTFTLRHEVNYFTTKFLRYIYHQVFIWLMLLAIYLFYNYSRLTNSKLKTFSAHCFDEYPQVKYPSSVHQEAIRTLRIFNPQGEILFRFLHEPVSKVP